jgi:hypothetical protein
MEQGRLARFAPLAGVVFFVLVLVAVFVNSSDTPSVGSSGGKVFAYYKAHNDNIEVADFLGVLAAVFVLWFSASLRSAVWRAEAGSGRLASLVLAGGVLTAGGMWTVFGLDFAVAEASKKVGPAVLLPLHALNDNFFFPLAGGVGVLMLASGFAVIRTVALPVWLGWVALVLGIVTFTPAGFVGVLGATIWILIASVILFLRQPAPEQPTVATTPAA